MDRVEWWISWRDTVFVYVMHGGALRKIGVSIDPYRRRKEVERLIEQEVHLEFFVSHPIRYWKKVEASVHQVLHNKRVRGEWFDVSSDEAENAVLRCLFDVVPEIGELAVCLDHDAARAWMMLRSERDLEAMYETDFDQIILRGPPGGMTATERLSAFLDWRYGRSSSGETASRHRLSKSTMSRNFRERLYGCQR